MRIIALKTLKWYIEKYPQAAGALKSWNEEISEADWKTPNDLKEQFGKASLIGKKRVIFNIHGNMFRLIVDVEYKFKLVFIVWFGTHKEYDKIDANAIKFDKID
jgi:mRNA interferase HigB